MNFLKHHGDRVIFMALSLALAGLLYWLDMQEEAKVIFIGVAMLCYNKARGAQ